MEYKGKGGAVGGARRKETKRTARRNTKGFASAVAEYLISDSYLYAPLIDSHHHPPADEIPSPPPSSSHDRVAVMESFANCRCSAPYSSQALREHRTDFTREPLIPLKSA